MQGINSVIIILLVFIFVFLLFSFLFTYVFIKKNKDFFKFKKEKEEIESLKNKLEEIKIQNQFLSEKSASIVDFNNNLLSQLNNQFFNLNMQQENSQKQNIDTIFKIQESLSLSLNKANDKNQELQKKDNELLIVNVKKISETLVEVLNNISNVIKNSLNQIDHTTKERLEKIEGTVKEKLDENISQSIKNAFSVIADQLKKLDESLSQVNQLSNDIKTFDNILRGVKTRGILGEVILKDILDEILGSQLYEEQFSLKKNSLEKVDFAIKIPGQDSKCMYFPIDSKFPLSSYEDLLNAKKEGNQEKIDKATKSLFDSIINQAKNIKKYIIPEITTPFAGMYLPSEGLYAEVISTPGLAKKVKDVGNILIMGPSVLAAWLSVLKVGFQTVTIQKKSAEIISTFIQFKKDFSFILSEIDNARKGNEKITVALDNLTKRTNKIQNKIENFHEIDDSPKLENKD